jgi:anti-sigma regulatory factor (Ser/Thr protein kinase)
MMPPSRWRWVDEPPQRSSEPNVSMRAGQAGDTSPGAFGQVRRSGPAHGPSPSPRPLHSYLELGALPTAVPCARLHARHLLWEWGMSLLAETTELLVSELVTNAVKATAGHRDRVPVRLQVSRDSARVLIEVWDADPRPPALQDLSEDGMPDPQKEGGRGLFLVAALSDRWDWYPTQEPLGKVIWCEVRVLPPAAAPRSLEDHGAGCQAGSRPVNAMSRSSGGAESGTLTGGPNRPGLPSGFCSTADSTNAYAASISGVSQA